MINVYDSNDKKRRLIAITPDEDLTVSHGDETPIGSIGLLEGTIESFQLLYDCLKDILDIDESGEDE